VRSPTCPDRHPETGWLRYVPGEGLVLQPFRTLADDTAGRSYARRHGLAFPFPNDFYDARLGGPHRVRLARDTVCSGIVQVGYREPLHDHRVGCGLLTRVASTAPSLPVAVWTVGNRPVQVSELYRP
jgi:hypothetical protein